MHRDGSSASIIITVIKIKKVLNSSVVLGEKLFGKGIDYGQKTGSIIEEQQADHIFLPVENIKVKEFLGLLDTIPPVFIELTQQIVNFAEEKTRSLIRVSTLR